MYSRRSSVLWGKGLQAEPECCAFCDQPSSQLDWFWVSCIEESSRSYRWTRWITKDPRKLNACFTLVQSLPAAIFCYAVVMLRDWNEMLFPWLGFVILHVLLFRRLSGWNEIAVKLPHCGKHRGIRKAENQNHEHKSRTSRLLQNKHFQTVMIGILVAYMVVVLLYALFVKDDGKVYVTLFLVPVILMGLPVALVLSSIGLLIDMRRFIFSPYGISSEGKVREVWHIAHNYCQAANEASIAREIIEESCQDIDVGTQTDGQTQ